MAGLLGDGQKFKRRDKDDKVGGGGRGGEGRLLIFARYVFKCTAS